jgi:hypothetical protein
VSAAILPANLADCAVRIGRAVRQIAIKGCPTEAIATAIEGLRDQGAVEADAVLQHRGIRREQRSFEPHHALTNAGSLRQVPNEMTGRERT